jgi:hypothetical protein
MKTLAVLSLAAPTAQTALVGLLTSEPHVATAFSPNRWQNAFAFCLAPAMAHEKTTCVTARLQRRGRPGFTPEFPVCRPKTQTSGRPPTHSTQYTAVAAHCKRHGYLISRLSWEYLPTSQHEAPSPVQSDPQELLALGRTLVGLMHAAMTLNRSPNRLVRARQ